MTGGRGSFAARFRAVAAERIARVVAALDANDPDEARREIHGLKGEARVVGFEPIAEIAHALETLLAESAPRPQLDEGVALIDHALELRPDEEPPGMAAFLRRERASTEPSVAEPLAWIASRAADSFLRVDMDVLGRLTRSVSEVRATERALLGLVASLGELLQDDDRGPTTRWPRHARSRSTIASAATPSPAICAGCGPSRSGSSSSRSRGRSRSSRRSSAKR